MRSAEFKISIITVCFNAEKYIERTILSVLNQEFVLFEYLIIDGKSTDGTMTIIKQLWASNSEGNQRTRSRYI